MKYVILLSLIFLYSCASNERSSSVSGNSEKVDKEFDWVENSDFKKVEEVPFVSTQDLFNEVMNDDSLSTESIARLPESRIEKISGSNNPVNQGIAKCYTKEFDQAEKIFEVHYQRYKKNPIYWNQIGTCQFLKGEFRRALLFYNKARSLNANYAPPVNNIGVIHQRQGKDQKALAAYRKASELNKFSLTPNFNLAQLYLKYGFVQKSQAILDGLLLRNSSDVDVLNALGTASMMAGSYKESLRYFSKIPRDDLKKARIGLNYSMALKKVGYTDDAQSVFKRIENDSIGDLGTYYSKIGRYVND